MDSATSSSPRIGTVVQDQDAVRPTMTGETHHAVGLIELGQNMQCIMATLPCKLLRLCALAWLLCRS